MNARKKALLVLSFFIEIENEDKVRENIDPDKLDYIIKNGIKYKKLKKKKKDGGIRNILAPSKDLKTVQGQIKNNLLYKVPVHKKLYGYVPKVQMKSGAKSHLMLNKIRGEYISPWMLKLDIKKFFPSIKKSMIENMFFDIFTVILLDKEVKEFEVFEEFCILVALICTHRGVLVEGAPTSSYLSNLYVSWCGMIDELDQYCEECSLNFSAYSDDLCLLRCMQVV